MSGTRPIDGEEALTLAGRKGPAFLDLVRRAGRVRTETRGDDVYACSIVNAKSGSCSEDCSFCAQSVHNAVAGGQRCYPLISAEALLRCAEAAQRNGAFRFGIVTSGHSLHGLRELELVAEAVALIRRNLDVEVCASLGYATVRELSMLREAGLSRYHHNLETGASFFPSVCTTHDYSSRVRTVSRAIAVGLATCSGGIFGLGESVAQRVEMLTSLQTLDVDSVPLNFLCPIPGTPMADRPVLPPSECLEIIALARLMLPDKEIRVCAGRESCLGEMEPIIFAAGADGIMIGGYLTVAGRSAAADIAMVEQAGMRLVTKPDEGAGRREEGEGQR